MRGKRRSFEIWLKSRHNGGWVIILLSGRAVRSDALVSLTADDAGPAGVSARCFIPLRLGRWIFAQVLLVSVQGPGQRGLVELDGAASGESVKLRQIAVPQAAAALVLICLQPSILRRSGPGQRLSSRNSLRKRLAVAAIRLGPRISYPAWQRRFDRWTAEPGLALPGTVMALVFTDGDLGRPALDATLAALAAVPATVQVTLIDGAAGDAGGALRVALEAAPVDFVVVLQAGEIIAPHAIGALIRFAEIRRLDIVYADEDRVDLAGVRSEPLFKPEPSRMLMLSGALATGVFLIRRDVLAGFGATASCADALRMAVWLWLSADSMAGFSGRLPLILTHRRPDTAATPPGMLAAIAQAHLGPGWAGEIDAARLPLRIRPGIRGLAPKVSLIVASTGRLAHTRSCLHAILEQTDYPNFEMIIVLSQAPLLDTRQRKNLAPVLADARVRVVYAPMERFNYARANNVAVAHSEAPVICLLNDDVAPITPDWLRVMVGHFQDPQIAVVGAKLYYPDTMVQHGGMIMGLSGVCDHAYRFLPRFEAGYAGRALVEQEFSAVTGACMLIRRPVFDAAGGLDEHFASAYNDVDLCLKIRAAGHGVVCSAQAELWHHESISFGKHYADADKLRETRDFAIMRQRWGAQCADDPFHNPNLSLEMQKEAELAFPPRLSDLPKALGLAAAD